MPRASKATEPKAKAVKAPAKPKAAAKPKPAAAVHEPITVPSTAGVHIVSSKVCQAFAKRVADLTKAVAAAKPGVAVTVDTQLALGRKPDRGSFIVTAGGTIVVELVSMPRPFTAMKALDMGDVAKQVIAKL